MALNGLRCAVEKLPIGLRYPPKKWFVWKTEQLVCSMCA